RSSNDYIRAILQPEGLAGISQTLAGSTGSARRGIGSFFAGAIYEQRQESVHDNGDKHYPLNKIFFIFSGTVLEALGLMLLFKTWRPVNFYTAANVHIVPRLLLSACLIWMGMGIFFIVFGL